MDPQRGVPWPDPCQSQGTWFRGGCGDQPPNYFNSPQAQQSPQDPDGGVGNRQQLVLRIAARWRPEAFKNSCLVTSGPAERVRELWPHSTSPSRGAALRGGEEPRQLRADVIRLQLTLLSGMAGRGSGWQPAPNQHLRPPVPPQDNALYKPGGLLGC